MKNYEIQENEFGKTISYKIGNRKISFRETPGNVDYQEYLRYTEWVEAGNTPEDFWTQSDELIEPSEPKEEKEEAPQEIEGES